MSAYRATRDYRAVYRSQPIGFSKGDDVDLDPIVADWVNRDSPGCLKATGKPEASNEEPAAEAPATEPAETEPDKPKRGKSRARS